MFGSFSFTVINPFLGLNLKFRVKLLRNPAKSYRTNNSAAAVVSTQLGYAIIYSPISQHIGRNNIVTSHDQAVSEVSSAQGGAGRLATSHTNTFLSVEGQSEVAGENIWS